MHLQPLLLYPIRSQELNEVISMTQVQQNLQNNQYCHSRLPPFFNPKVLWVILSVHLSTSLPSLEASRFLASEENPLYDLCEGAGLRQREKHKDLFDFAQALTCRTDFYNERSNPPARLTVVL